MPPPDQNLYLDFLARSLYVKESHSAGNAPCRWGVLREDLKEKFRGMAETMVQGWHGDEEEARKRREETPHPRDKPKV